MTFQFPRLFRRKQVFARTAVRYDCAIDCEIVLTDSMVSYEGRIINMSAGGAMFRPRLTYLMDRRDVPVTLRSGPLALSGILVNTSRDGFGIRFNQPLDDAALREYLAHHGGLVAMAA